MTSGKEPTSDGNRSLRLIKTPDWFKSPETRFSDVASAVRKVFATVEEAEDYAKSLGVHANYGQRLDIAQLSNEFLARLKDRDLPMPLTVMLHPEHFALKYPVIQEQIAAMGESGVILINPAADFWKTPIEISRALYRAAYWSTPSPLHVFFHEYAHLSQQETTRNQALTRKQKTLAASVSDRAGENVEEFLSEVYAGLMEGVQYDSDILGAYHR